ncbi:MAG: hypothetical protein JW751_23725 [Polyangiaceae bacterium]|nr:hypothetical protein [Polyangiaceae bacterium]
MINHSAGEEEFPILYDVSLTSLRDAMTGTAKTRDGVYPTRRDRLSREEMDALANDGETNTPACLVR